MDVCRHLPWRRSRRWRERAKTRCMSGVFQSTTCFQKSLKKNDNEHSVSKGAAAGAAARAAAAACAAASEATTAQAVVKAQAVAETVAAPATAYVFEENSIDTLIIYFLFFSQVFVRRKLSRSAANNKPKKRAESSYTCESKIVNQSEENHGKFIGKMALIIMVIFGQNMA